jgi:hypothetical protein
VHARSFGLDVRAQPQGCSELQSQILPAPVHRTLKRIGWSVTVLALIPLALYVVLLAFNWRDRPPSLSAVRLTDASLAQPAVADADNAYVYMMGFAVARDQDPRSAGAVRAAWAGDFVRGATTSTDPLRPAIDIEQSRAPAVRELAQVCVTASELCAGSLETDRSILQRWLNDEQWLVARYEALLAHASWREPTPFDLRIPFPSYSIVLDAQRVFHVRAWTLAQNGDADAVRDMLSRDIRFWRMTLRSADVLITKMMAVAALRHHFEFGNLALRRLPAQVMRRAVPSEWLTEISLAERSMLRCFAGEWKYLDKVVHDAKRGDERALALDEGSPAARRMLWRALNPLLQAQDSSNDTAERFVMLATSLDVPYTEFVPALAKLRERMRSDPPSAQLPAYNTLGVLLEYNAPVDYTAYAVRVADVEGIRRAALLTTLLRADRATESEIGAHIAASDIRDPYSAKPFSWDERAHAVVFTGLEDSEQRVHAFLF